MAAYKTLRNQQRLFVEAPTGTGKTISTLFPAFKALGEERADRVFYLTAKTITRQVAEDAITALSEKGAQAKSVTLTAKDKICFLDERKCNPDDCIYANGYYNRINEGLWDLLNHENQLIVFLMLLRLLLDGLSHVLLTLEKSLNSCNVPPQ